jgi:hypothetical protein
MYRDKKTGQFRQCRVKSFTHNDDPMNDYAGSDVCAEIANDLRKKDLRDGCTECRREVAENASEPDVMARWDLRR